MDHEEKQQWVRTQERTFARWINSRLAKHGRELVDEEDLAHAWTDGLKLIELLEILFNKKCTRRLNHSPKSNIHRLDNINNALELLKECRIRPDVDGHNLLTGSPLNLLLGMVWMIIMEFNISGISEGNMSARKGLLLWVNRMCAPHELTVNDFSRSFYLARPIAAIVSTCRPAILDYSSLNFEDESTVETILKAASECGVPKLLDASDLLDRNNIDDKSVMTYCSEMYHAFAGDAFRTQLAAVIDHFLLRAHNILDAEISFHSLAKRFVEFCDTQIEKFNALDTTTLSQNDATQLLASFREYQLEERPRHQVHKLEAENRLFEATRLRTLNNWKPMKPMITQDQLTERANALNLAEERYCERLRDHQLQLLTRPQEEISAERITEIETIYHRFAEEAKESGSSLGNGVGEEEFEAILMALNVAISGNINEMFKNLNGGNDITLEQLKSFIVEREVKLDTAKAVNNAFHAFANAESITKEQLKHPAIDQNNVVYVFEHEASGGDRLAYGELISKFYNEELE